MIKNFNLEEVKKEYSKDTIMLAYPSVVKRERPWGEKFWLALWIQDGIPQHCQCQSEEEGWYLIAHQMR